MITLFEYVHAFQYVNAFLENDHRWITIISLSTATLYCS